MNLGVLIASVILALLILLGATDIIYGILWIKRSAERFRLREWFRSQGPNGLTGIHWIRVGVLRLLAAAIVAWILFYHIRWGGNFWRPK